MWRQLTYLVLFVLLLGVPVDIVSGDITSDLISYWKLDDGSGSTASDSAGTNEGTLQGDATWAAGWLGGAVQLDGDDDYVDCGEGTVFNTVCRDVITLAAWVQADPALGPDWGGIIIRGYGYLFGDVDPYDTFAMYYHRPGERLGFKTNSTSPEWVASPNGSAATVFDGEWHHVASVYDGAEKAIYLDSTEILRAAATGQIGIGEGTGRVLIGGGRDAEPMVIEFGGLIDEARIYDRALTQNDIVALMEYTGEPSPYAAGPSPAVGEMLTATSANLSWRPGDFAALHDVYFGEDYEQVSAATTDDVDVFLGRQVTTQVPVGMAGTLYPESLAPGQTYYWRVDEVNDLDPNSPWKGNIWSFSIQPVTAYEPFPIDGMKHVDPDQDLSWQAGMGTIFHKIFLGESFDEVDNAVAPLTMSTAPTASVGPLELAKTYYWRVDEFGQTGEYKGPVWSFTTRGNEGGVTAEYFDGMELAGDPVLTQVEPTIDHSWGNGEVAAGLIDNVSARWRANLEAPFSETFTLTTTSDDGVRLWLDGRQIIDNWTDHGTTDNSAKVDFVAGQVYLVVMEYYENTGGAAAQLSWQSPTIPRQIVPQGWLQLPHWATSPSPANAEPYAPQAPILTWTAGDEATAHDVYLGEDADAVANATPADAAIYRGQQAAGATSFNPGPLQWNKTYYWRVDEVNPAHADSPWKGAVWSFTTADFLIVEDFESYSNEVGQRVFETWIDGVGFSQPAPGHPGNGTGAAVGHDIWSVESPYYNGSIMEIDNVHGGHQAMPLYYDNTEAPARSETDRTFTPGRNWTVEGVTTLVVHFRGHPDNTGQLYAEINGVKVPYDGDPTDIAKRSWVAWEIDLAPLGLSLTNITTLTIGIEGGQTGVLLIDDIRVTK